MSLTNEEIAEIATEATRAALAEHINDTDNGDMDGFTLGVLTTKVDQNAAAIKQNGENTKELTSAFYDFKTSTSAEFTEIRDRIDRKFNLMVLAIFIFAVASFIANNFVG